jgi:hypothetical protein
LTPEQPRTALEVVALLREYEGWNGGKNHDFVHRPEWMKSLRLLVDDLELDLAALRKAAPYVSGTDDARDITDAIRRLSGVLAS